MAKRKTLFDDRPIEISELTYIIRQDIASLNTQIASLQTYVRSQKEGGKASTKGGAGVVDEHNTNVVMLLQSRLANMGMGFKDVLELRTQVSEQGRVLSVEEGVFWGGASCMSRRGGKCSWVGGCSGGGRRAAHTGAAGGHRSGGRVREEGCVWRRDYKRAAAKVEMSVKLLTTEYESEQRPDRAVHAHHIERLSPTTCEQYVTPLTL